MKFITGAIIGALAMTLAVNPSNSFSVKTADRAAIDTIVESVANGTQTKIKPKYSPNYLYKL
ncbi:hypothetical protein [Myxosarcina sp. GI1(2024)]